MERWFHSVLKVPDKKCITVVLKQEKMKKKKKKPKEISLNEFAMQDSKGNTN